MRLARNSLQSLFFILLWLLFSISAVADPQSKSFSHWHITDNTISATFTVAGREATRLPDYQYNPNLSQIFLAHLSENISVHNNGVACELLAPLALRAKTGYLQYMLQFHCDQPLAIIRITINTLMTVSPSHVHFAKFSIDNKPPFEHLYTSRQFHHELNLKGIVDNSVSQNSVGETLLTYIQFGFEHIIIGADHIAFLLTLLLLANRLRDIIFIVTGFTLGHSVTLSLATLGIASPNMMVVEAMIGFTVALVAIENVAAQSGNSKQIATICAACLGLLTLLAAFAGIGPPLLSIAGLTLFTFCFLRLSDSVDKALAMRPMVTTCFGLIHGFGFANVLLEVGLPERQIITALFGFNIGVELGQIAIVLGLVAIVWLMKKVVRQQQFISECVSAALCGVGVFWFIQRAYF